MEHDIKNGLFVLNPLWKILCKGVAYHEFASPLCMDDHLCLGGSMGTCSVFCANLLF